MMHEYVKHNITALLLSRLTVWALIAKTYIYFILKLFNIDASFYLKCGIN